jgi:hypothetical protein
MARRTANYLVREQSLKSLPASKASFVNHQQQPTASEYDTGRSTLHTGTGLRAPFPTFPSGTAVDALVGKGFGLQPPSAALAATPAGKPVWPTSLEQVLHTGAFHRSDRGNRCSNPDTPLTLLIGSA